MSRIVISILVITLTTAPVAAGQAPVDAASEATALRALIAAVPLGTKVNVQTSAGRRVSGTLMQVTTDTMVIKRSTRLPEPAVAVPIAEIARIDRVSPNGGMSLAKAIGVGVGAGAGAILAMVAIALAISD